MKYSKTDDGLRGLSNWMGIVVYPLRRSAPVMTRTCFPDAALQIPRVRNEESRVIRSIRSGLQHPSPTRASSGIGVSPRSGSGSGSRSRTVADACDSVAGVSPRRNRLSLHLSRVVSSWGAWVMAYKYTSCSPSKFIFTPLKSRPTTKHLLT